MAQRAPGQDPPRHESSCYNCGSKDHFAYACPEPIRAEPAGLQAFKQQQAAQSHPGSGGKSSQNYNRSNSKSKGPIITRYAPPPSHSPPNAWGAGPPLPPTTTYAPSAPPPLPPHPTGYYPGPQAPPQYPPYPTYPPANPPQVAYGQSYPPHPPAPGPAYGQYGPPAYPPQPPPPTYGPPSSYGGTQYQPSYPPPVPQYSGAPPSYYQGPPVAAYGVPPPPLPQSSYPPGSYDQSYVPPPDPSGPYSDPYPPPNPGWHQKSNGYNQPRQRDRDRDRDRGGRPQQRGRGQRPQGRQRSPSISRHRSQHTTPKAAHASPASVDTSAKSKPKEPVTQPVVEAIAEPVADADDDFEWDLKHIFTEREFKPADPVGPPLPAEWNDDPTIPPAFNAKFIKSEFVNGNDPKTFSQSIRDSMYWAAMKTDPVFRYRPGMATIRFSGYSHEYFTYLVPNRVPTKAGEEFEVLSQPNDATLIDEAKPPTSVKPDRLGRTLPLGRNPKRSFDDVSGYRERDIKRRKSSPRRHFSPRSRSPPSLIGFSHADLSSDPWAPRPGETSSSRTDKWDRERDDFKNDASRIQDRDSGYQSAHSGKKRGTSQHGRSRPRSTSPYRREGGRRRSSSRSRSRSRSRTPRPSNRGYESDSSDSEDMSDMDYELLGLDRPKKVKKSATPNRVPIKRRPVKFNDAFGRRW